MRTVAVRLLLREPAHAIIDSLARQNPLRGALQRLDVDCQTNRTLAGVRFAHRLQFLVRTFSSVFRIGVVSVSADICEDHNLL